MEFRKYIESQLDAIRQHALSDGRLDASLLQGMKIYTAVADDSPYVKKGQLAVALDSNGVTWTMIVWHNGRAGQVPAVIKSKRFNWVLSGTKTFNSWDDLRQTNKPTERPEYNDEPDEDIPAMSNIEQVWNSLEFDDKRTNLIQIGVKDDDAYTLAGTIFRDLPLAIQLGVKRFFTSAIATPITELPSEEVWWSHLTSPQREKHLLNAITELGREGLLFIDTSESKRMSKWDFIKLPVQIRWWITNYFSKH